jgi:hypothetical protein
MYRYSAGALGGGQYRVRSSASPSPDRAALIWYDWRVNDPLATGSLLREAGRWRSAPSDYDAVSFAFRSASAIIAPSSRWMLSFDWLIPSVSAIRSASSVFRFPRTSSPLARYASAR